MDEHDVQIGNRYRMPNGMVDVIVINIDENPPGWCRVRLENISGKMIGFRRWESMRYFVGLDAEKI